MSEHSLQTQHKARCIIELVAARIAQEVGPEEVAFPFFDELEGWHCFRRSFLVVVFQGVVVSFSLFHS